MWYKFDMRTLVANFIVFRIFLSPLRVFLLTSRLWARDVTSGPCVAVRTIVCFVHGLSLTSSSSSSLSSTSSSLPKKKWIDALCTFMTGWKHPSAMMETGFASVLDADSGPARSDNRGLKRNSPDALLPQLLRHDDSPYRLLTIPRSPVRRGPLRGAQLPLVPDHLSLHPALDHAKQHRLHRAVQLMVLRAKIGRANIREDGLADERTQCRGRRAREEREQGLEQAGDRLCCWYWEGTGWHVLNGCDNVLVPQHDEVLHESLPCVGRKCAIVLQKQSGDVCREVRGFLGIARCNLRSGISNCAYTI